ncbi:hypothetical protein BIFGAL_03977 [Bifidobacterium gallicum DSM 20093 = LMG 11596]|nr:hypothetical protein BIFGAL_03977 [Bifidobacterium gallicum DSM 20093 = LMG 11596]
MVAALALQFLLVGFLVWLSFGSTVAFKRFDAERCHGAMICRAGSEERFHVFQGAPSFTFYTMLVVLLGVCIAAGTLLKRVPGRIVVAALLVYMTVAQIVWVASLSLYNYGYNDSLSLMSIANGINGLNGMPLNPSQMGSFAADACSGPHPMDYCDVGVPSSYRYLHMYPFQSGPALWFALVFQIFGANNIWGIQLCNAVFGTLIAGCLWYLAKRLGLGNFGTAICALLVAGFLPMTFISAFVYTNMVGFGLVLAGICVVVRSLDVARAWVSALVMFAGFTLCSLGIMFKSTYVIVVLAAIIAIVLAALCNKRYWQIPWGAGLGAVGYKLSSLLPLAYVQHVSGQTYGKGMPMTSWVMLGLSQDKRYPEREGWWTGAAIQIYDKADGDYGLQQQLIKQWLVQRTQELQGNPSQAWDFFHTKLIGEWSDPTFESLYYSGLGDSTSQFTGTLARLVAISPDSLAFQYMNVFQSMLYLTAFIGVIAIIVKLVRQRHEALDAAFVFTATTLSAGFIGGFLCYLLWEAKSVYTLPFFLLLIPLAAYGTVQIARGLALAYQTVRQRFANARTSTSASASTDASASANA